MIIKIVHVFQRLSMIFVCCQDLATLGTVGSASGPGNILVSAGVRVLKVPKRRVIELSPRGHMETFEENFSPKHRLELNCSLIRVLVDEDELCDMKILTIYSIWYRLLYAISIFLILISEFLCSLSL